MTEVNVEGRVRMDGYVREALAGSLAVVQRELVAQERLAQAARDTLEVEEERLRQWRERKDAIRAALAADGDQAPPEDAPQQAPQQEQPPATIHDIYAEQSTWRHWRGSYWRCSYGEDTWYPLEDEAVPAAVRRALPLDPAAAP